MDDDAKQYLQQHKVHYIVEQLVSSVVREKPNDPLDFFIDKLSEMQRQNDANADVASPKTPKSYDFGTAEGLNYLRSRFRQKAENDVLKRSAFLEVIGNATSPSDPITPRSEKISQLHAIFDTFDRDRNGSVDIDEFTNGIRILFSGTEVELLEFVFSGLDYDHDGGVTPEEFVKYFRNYFTAKCAVDGRKLETSRWNAIEDHLRRVFKGNDTNASGTIDMQEFRTAVRADPDHPFTLVWQSFAHHKPTANSPAAHRPGSSGSVRFPSHPHS